MENLPYLHDSVGRFHISNKNRILWLEPFQTQLHSQTVISTAQLHQGNGLTSRKLGCCRVGAAIEVPGADNTRLVT